MNVLFVLHFCLGKYSFRLDTFSTQLVFWRKWTSYSFFISVLVNTASISIPFQHSSYFEENERFIRSSFLSWEIQLQSRYLFNTARILKKMNVLFVLHFCLGKYSFSLDTFSTHLVFWRKWTFHPFFIYVLINTASVSLLLHFKYKLIKTLLILITERNERFTSDLVWFLYFEAAFSSLAISPPSVVFV